MIVWFLINIFCVTFPPRISRYLIVFSSFPCHTPRAGRAPVRLSLSNRWHSSGARFEKLQATQRIWGSWDSSHARLTRSLKCAKYEPFFILVEIGDTVRFRNVQLSDGFHMWVPPWSSTPMRPCGHGFQNPVRGPPCSRSVHVPPPYPGLALFHLVRTVDF